MLLRIKNQNGEFVDVPVIKGADGKDYILTDQDKIEIAGIAKDEIIDSEIFPTKEDLRTVVKDVKINGTALVHDENGAVSIPTTSQGRYGVLKASIDFGYYVQDGAFACGNYNYEQLKMKNPNAFMGIGSFFNAQESYVKSVGDAVYQPKEELELIETITLDGTETAITKLAEPNGNPYDFKAVRVYCENVLPQDATANRLLSINCARNSIQLGRMYFDSWKTQGYSILDVFQQRGIWECYRSSASGNSSFNYTIAYGTITSRMRKVADFPTINRIEITFNSVPVSGGKIHIYGVKA